MSFSTFHCFSLSSNLMELVFEVEGSVKILIFSFSNFVNEDLNSLEVFSLFNIIVKIVGC